MCRSRIQGGHPRVASFGGALQHCNGPIRVLSSESSSALRCTGIPYATHATIGTYTPSHLSNLHHIIIYVIYSISDNYLSTSYIANCSPFYLSSDLISSPNPARPFLSPYLTDGRATRYTSVPASPSPSLSWASCYPEYAKTLLRVCNFAP